MITYENLPPSAQKSYRLLNNVRKVTLFLSWIGVPALIILGLIVSIKEGSFPEKFTEDFILSFFLGSALQGLAHSIYIVKAVLEKTRTLLVILGIFAIIPYLIIVIGIPFFTAAYAGLIFTIIDTILLLKKKPLVYKWEHRFFLLERQAQAEMAVMAYSDCEQCK